MLEKQCSSTVSLPEVVISTTEWEARTQAHRQRVQMHAESFVQRRANGTKHPVWDFLFTYYSFSPNKLLTWLPGVQQTFARPAPEVDSTRHTWPSLKKRDLDQARWVAALCRNIQQKSSRFTCHGLHEWAMVYKQTPEQVRHSGYQLRVPAEQITGLIESQPLNCSHYDAFRFFTPEAVPLNAFRPDLETRLENEQGGCLHANMDLYKWATKLWLWVGSDLVADAFELALTARSMDMRASPYDLADLDFAPIPIETEAGRQQYRQEQHELAARAQPVREKLRHACEHLLQTASSAI